MPKSTFFHLQEEKQERIIQGAMEAFSEKTYRKVTIDRIVELSKIPKGSFYQYFADKDDLFMYIFSELGDEKKEAFEAVFDQMETSTFEEFIGILLLEANHFENRDPVMVGLKDRFLHECPQKVKNEIMKSVIPKSYDLFGRIIQTYQDKGELKKTVSVKEAAYILTSVITQLEYYDFTEEEAPMQTVKRIMRVIVQGLGKEESYDTDS